MKILPRVFLPAVALLFALAANAQQSLFPTGEFIFMMEAQEAYLIANEAPLIDILAEISSLTGIPVEIDSDNDSLITTDLRAKSLEQIINSITPGSVMTFSHGETPDQYLIESICVTGVGDPVAIGNRARQRVVEENHLDERLRSRFRRPVRFVGIGANISVTTDRKGLWLRPINEDSPAHKGGIRMGDMAIAIDGRRIDEFRHLGEAIQAIRGEADTPVKFLIHQPDGTETIKTVVRELFEYDPSKQKK